MTNDIKLGIKYMLFASLLSALMTGFVKELSNSLNSLEIVFFRNVLGIAIVLYLIYKKPIKQRGGRPFLLLARCFIGFAALVMWFYNVSAISLAEAITFSQTAPIWTAIFAYVFIKEKLSSKEWLGVFVGFVGILFIVQFDGTSLNKTDYLGILSGVLAGLAYTSIRELNFYYDSRVIVLSFVGIGTIFPIFLMIIAQFYTNPNFDFIIAPFVMPEAKDWLNILLMGIVSTYMQVYLTKAYTCAKAGIVGTISYSNIVFGIIIGIFLGDAFPNIWIIFGIILIVLSGYLATAKEKNKKVL